MLKRKRTAAAVIVGTLVAAGVAVGAIAPIKPYAVGIAGGYETKRLLSVATPFPRRATGTRSTA